MLVFILFQVLYIPNGSHIDLGCLVNIIENLNLHQRILCPNAFQLKNRKLNYLLFRTLTFPVYGDDMNDTLRGIKILSFQSHASGGSWSINQLIAVIVSSLMLAISQSILRIIWNLGPTHYSISFLIFCSVLVARTIETIAFFRRATFSSDG